MGRPGLTGTGQPRSAGVPGCTASTTRYSGAACGCSSMAEHQLPKLTVRVRFPSPAPREGPGQDESPSQGLDAVEASSARRRPHRPCRRAPPARRAKQSRPRVQGEPGRRRLALVDAEGRWIRPGIPLASCHNHLPDAVNEALDALPLTTVATRPLAEIESARPDMAGCGQRWVDMAEVATMADPDALPGTLRSPFLAGQTVRLCVYDVPRSEQESGKAAGVLVHGTVLRGGRRAAVEDAVEHAASEPVQRPRQSLRGAEANDRQ